MSEYTRMIECVICGNAVGYMKKSSYKQKRKLNIRCEGCVSSRDKVEAEK